MLLTKIYLYHPNFFDNCDLTSFFLFYSTNFEFLSGMLLPRNLNGSSSFYKGPRTCKVSKSADPTPIYISQECPTTTNFSLQRVKSSKFFSGMCTSTMALYYYYEAKRLLRRKKVNLSRYVSQVSKYFPHLILLVQKISY